MFSDIHETAVKITQTAIDETAAKWIPENCVIVAIFGATAGRSGINKIPLTTNQHCCCLEIDHEQALYRYVFHWVSMNYEKLKEMGQGARGDLNSGIIKGFQIPIPCPENPKKSLEIQAEIVRILDKFTELSARRKKYNYYRDQLLNFEEGHVEWKTLGDVDFFEVASGGTPSKSKPEYWVGGNIPWLKSESCNNESVFSASNFITELGLQK